MQRNIAMPVRAHAADGNTSPSEEQNVEEGPTRVRADAHLDAQVGHVRHAEARDATERVDQEVGHVLRVRRLLDRHPAGHAVHVVLLLDLVHVVALDQTVKQSAETTTNIHHVEFFQNSLPSRTKKQEVPRREP